jgi:hypothetical protein
VRYSSQPSPKLPRSKLRFIFVSLSRRIVPSGKKERERILRSKTTVETMVRIFKTIKITLPTEKVKGTTLFLVIYASEKRISPSIIPTSPLSVKKREGKKQREKKCVSFLWYTVCLMIEIEKRRCKKWMKELPF